MKNEKKFYEKLTETFIGAKVEGEGGFINLMKIKSNYFNKIFDTLKRDIDERVKDNEDFKEEMFDKLYNFFDRYFTKSGSIYFDRTAYHSSIYEKVYTDERDVILFWKTHMLYYVKTDRIFNSMPVEFDSLKFYFDVSRLESKKSNEKRSLIYEFKEKRVDQTIVFSVLYSENGKITKTDEILKKIKKEGIEIKEEQFERATRVFEKQSEVDFFINKDAKTFLEEQFKLYIYQYMFEDKDVWKENRVKELQILKETAYDITKYVSQFENELVMIWNKPKFARKSNYVVTLDRLTTNNGGFDVVKKILSHSNISKQQKEWHELGITDDKFKLENVLVNSLNGETLAENFKTLPIDTKYFKDIELEIIGVFENLDKALDGRLIKSENYQVLNTIRNKFIGKIQTIYIDPPFNLDSTDQFLYRTNYKDSNWATLLENRITLSKDLLNEKGSMFVRCDYNGNWIVRCLMDEKFERINYQNEIILSKSAKLTEQINKYHSGHDTLFFYSRNNNKFTFEPSTRKRDDPKWRGMHLPGIRWSPIPAEYLNLYNKQNIKEKNGKFSTRARVILGNELLPPDNRHWALSQKDIITLESQGKIKNDDNGEPISIESDYQKLTDNWTDWVGYSSIWSFSTENNEKILKRIVETSSQTKHEIILDYFVGIGTTIAVAHKLERKWLASEMGSHFNSYETDKGASGILSRMKEVLAAKGNHEPCGISNEIKWKGGGFFKYYELEQYEETLKNCKYEDGDIFERPGEKPYNEYIFLKDEKMLKTVEIDYKNSKVNVRLNELYDDIDIAETLSNLTGKWIKKISKNKVEFEDGEVIDTQEIDYKLIKPLIWWEQKIS